METKKIVKVSVIALGGVLGIAILLMIIRSMTPGGSLTQSSYDGTMGYLGASSSSIADSMTQFKSVTNNSPQGGQSRSEVITSEPPAVEAQIPSISDRKVIKNGNLTLKVDNVDRVSQEISDIAKQNDGQVFSSNIQQATESVKSGYIMVKIPVIAFEKTFLDLKKIASFVVSESTSGQDVTEQYTDLQAQLRNKQSEEQAFQKILDQNAGKIDDILAVTREISRVRGDIERLQGRIKLMESQTDFSTINVAISEEVTVGGEVVSWRPWQIMKDEVNNLFKDMQGFINLLIYVVVRLIPMLIVLGVVAMLLWKLGKTVRVKFSGSRDKGVIGKK